MDKLKRQLKQMEDAFLAQQKMIAQMETLALSQQEQIKDLKNRIETMSEKPVTVAKEEITEQGSEQDKNENRIRLQYQIMF